MDRQIVYGTAVPRSIDLLATGQNAMVGLAKIASAMLGAGPFVDEFTCTATAPASLTVNLGPGQIYQQQALEATPVSALPADTHIILKQGVLLDPTALTFVPPTTLGQAVNVLIQIQYVDADSNPIVLPYNNPNNPKQPYAGPGNNNQAQPTVRKGAVAVAQKLRRRSHGRHAEHSDAGFRLGRPVLGHADVRPDHDYVRQHRDLRQRALHRCQARASPAGGPGQPVDLRE